MNKGNKTDYKQPHKFDDSGERDSFGRGNSCRCGLPEFFYIHSVDAINITHKPMTNTNKDTNKELVSIEDALEVLKDITKNCDIETQTNIEVLFRRMIVKSKQERERVIEEIKKLRKKDTTAKDLRSGKYNRGDDSYREGYNQAVEDSIKTLSEKESGND